MRYVLPAALVAILAAAITAHLVRAAPAAPSPASAEWPTYGHDAGGARFSPLTQITSANVAKLQPAWVYHMRPANLASPAGTEDMEAQGPHRRGPYAASEATPIVVKGVMYLPTPYGRVVALDASTGKQLWAYAAPYHDQAATRGVEYWPGSSGAAPEIVFGTRAGKLVALRAADGRPVPGFGTDGVIDMKTPEVMNGEPAAPLGMSSPPLIYKDLIITGSRVQEMPTIGAAGDVRAWDARTGKLVWTFHSVPRPGEVGHDTWVGDSWKRRSGVNVWTFLLLDQKRGVLYMPFGAPTFDRWGGDRHGANLFGNAVVAVDAATGKYLWHFQTVHHDIWDLDVPSISLIEVKRGGHDIPAIAVMNKTAILFILNRVTGEPIYKVTETAVPTDTDIPGEQPWPTQPMPSAPPPLAKLSWAPTDIADLTPELKAACEKVVQRMHIVASKPFQPLRADSAVNFFPGSLGGLDWGGGAFDPKLGYYIANTNNLASPEQLVKQPDGSWNMKDGYVYFMDFKQRMPCQKPPWGQITAVDVNTGKIAWVRNLGVTDALPKGLQDTGRPSAGGPITTASGLTFIGAADDGRIRAFETRTGKEVWTFKLPASIYATPITYQGRGGVQYVAAVATGGFGGSPISGDEVIAFALPPSEGGPVRAQPVSLVMPPLPPGSSAAPSAAAGAPQTYPELNDPPPAAALDLIRTKCVACHTASTIFTRRKTPSDWAGTVQSMADRGAEVSPDEVSAIASYLSKVLPPPDGGH
ncbi:MAG: PQQ-binding-like beta-propeller repeat protein [Caulobacteraceae bacterium]